MKDNDKVKMDDIFRNRRDDNLKPAGHDVRRNGDTELKAKDGPIQRKEKIESQLKPESKTKSKLNINKKLNKKWKRPVIIAGCVVMLGLIGWGVYSFIQLNNIQNPEYAEQQVQQETESLTNQVAKLIELPEGEPVIATVSDKEKLADQPFFDKAENGDKVLIFSESSMAIIYRESENKIINSGPIAITSDEAADEVTQMEGSL